MTQDPDESQEVRRCLGGPPGAQPMELDGHARADVSIPSLPFDKDAQVEICVSALSSDKASP